MDPIDWPDWYPWSPGSSGNSSAFVWGWGAPVIFAHLPIILIDDITIFGFNSQVFGRTSEQVITRCYTSTQYELKWCFRIYCRVFREISGIYFFCTLKDLEGSSNFLPGSLKLRWGGGLPKCWTVARWHWMNNWTLADLIIDDCSHMSYGQYSWLITINRG